MVKWEGAVNSGQIPTDDELDYWRSAALRGFHHPSSVSVSEFVDWCAKAASAVRASGQSWMSFLEAYDARRRQREAAASIDRQS